MDKFYYKKQLEKARKSALDNVGTKFKNPDSKEQSVKQQEGLMRKSSSGPVEATSVSKGLGQSLMEAMHKKDLEEEARKSLKDIRPQYRGDATTPKGANVDELRSLMVAKGLPEHVADGFLINFADESGFNPDIQEKNPLVEGSRGGRGLYQLTGPRRKRFEELYGENGYTNSNQIDFMIDELHSTEKSAFNKIMKTGNKQDAAVAVLNSFLRPSAKHRKAREARYKRFK